MNYDAIIVASGKGQRANLGYNKVFYRMKDGKTVLEHAMSVFLEDEECKKIIVVTNESGFNEVPNYYKVSVTAGGKERRDSVFNGLKESESEYVLIHDGARPFLQKEALQKLKEETERSSAAILGRYATDTIKIVKDGKIIDTLDRNTIFLAETPQGFRRELILDCYNRCGNTPFTDDASLAEHMGYQVSAVENPYPNQKLTKEEDFTDL